MDRATALRERLEDLRQSFDRAFAEAREPRRDETLTLLSIRVGRDPHAVRLSDVAALELRCAVTPVPSEHPELLGIAGLRGAVVAVFDLAALIGASRGDAPWVLLAKGAPVAFAFAEFEGVWSVRAEELVRAQGARGARAQDVVLRGGQPLPVIDLAGLVGDLGHARARRVAPREDGG
jgi:chemotaxis signal transduction protein